MAQKTLLVWIRYELRCFDNPLFAKDLLSQFNHVVPVYVIDPSLFPSTRTFGLPRCSSNRGRFLIESLEDLRAKLVKLGSNLIIRSGPPAAALESLANEVHATDAIWCSHVGTEEERDSLNTQAILQKKGVNVRNPLWDMTLLHPEDMPFKNVEKEIPDSFTRFRKVVEGGQGIRVRECFPVPSSFPTLPAGLRGKEGNIPSLKELATNELQGWSKAELGGDFSSQLSLEFDMKAPPRFAGGETAGQARMKGWMWDGNHLKTYKETRDGLLGDDYASHLSPYLSLGLVSARSIYHEVKRYEKSKNLQGNVNTYWIIFELLWRDYFKFVTLKMKSVMFRLYGSHAHADPKDPPWLRDAQLFRKWALGETGYPLIDAAMNELRLSGYMGNRARQFVASFLTKDMGLDWRLGAEWFEGQLIDSDVSSNWGNWQYQAGVGNDCREVRYFNLAKQAKSFDPDGTFRRHWCKDTRLKPCLPELGMYAGTHSARGGVANNRGDNMSGKRSINDRGSDNHGSSNRSSGNLNTGNNRNYHTTSRNTDARHTPARQPVTSGGHSNSATSGSNHNLHNAAREHNNSGSAGGHTNSGSNYNSASAGEHSAVGNHNVHNAASSSNNYNPPNAASASSNHNTVASHSEKKNDNAHRTRPRVRMHVSKSGD